MSNITPQGWESQSVERIVEELIARAEADYGTSFPTTPDSFAGQFFNIMAAQEKKIQDLGQAITSTQNLSTCSGIYLDYIADHKNTRRFKASGSYGQLLITGNQGLFVSIGTPFKDVTSRTVLTTEDLTLNRASCYSGTFTINTVSDSTDYSITIEGQAYTYNSGIGATEVTILQGLESALAAGSSVFTTAVVDSSIVIHNATRSNTLTLANSLNIQLASIGSLVSAEAITLGPYIYPAATVNTVVINSLNINSVTNPFDFTVGRFEESDPELRARLELSGEQAGVATIPAMQAALTEVDGVSGVLIVDNKTDFTDGNGIPPRSFESFVVGGDDQEIGEKLFDIQPAGISTHGDITIQFDDINGDPQTASFSRKGTQVAWIEVDYTINDEEDFPAEGEELMTQAIISQGNSMYSGEDLVANKFMAACYSVEGVFINEIRIAVTPTLGDTPTYQTGRISVNSNQALVFSTESITIINT